ncbi:hypothetical protein ACTXT7_012393 [Hymenolepis weldensis]
MLQFRKPKKANQQKWRFFPQKIKAKMSSNVSKTSTITVSLNSKHSSQSPVAPVPPKVSSTAIPVEVTIDNLKLLPSVGDTVKLTGFTHSMESFMPKIIPVRLVSEPTVPMRQSVRNPARMNIRQIKYAA